MNKMVRRTKIIATLGPASWDPATVAQLIEAGVDVFRLNFSHGSFADHERSFRTVRECAAAADRPIAVMQDLQGPKLRTGPLASDEPVELVAGARFVLTTRDVKGTSECVGTSYKEIVRDVRPGMTILLRDGAISLEVDKIDGDDVICTVVNGGTLPAHQGIHLPDSDVSLPSLTEKDIKDLEFGLNLGVDFVALSFVRSSADMKLLRDKIAGFGGRANVVSKIEKPQALDDIDAIIGLSDAVMVARGDLGVEMAAEQVPQIQKSLIAACNAAGVPVITATQMLESMIHEPRPTRAEASDVANAIYDGTDGVMLSGETAVGEYPVETVEMMARIAERADVDRANRFGRIRRRQHGIELGFADAVGHATCDAAADIRASLILCFTMSGFTAKVIAKHRPHTSIVAATQSDETCRSLALCWGVEPIILPPVASTDDMVDTVEKTLLDRGLAHRGDALIITAGTPLLSSGTTNLIKLHRI